MKKKVVKKINATEALFGFCGWLTSRKEETILSSECPCENIYDLIEEFCDVNALPSTTKNYPNNLIMPEE